MYWLMQMKIYIVHGSTTNQYTRQEKHIRESCLPRFWQRDNLSRGQRIQVFDVPPFRLDDLERIDAKGEEKTADEQND